jgi:hypothetical protein
MFLILEITVCSQRGRKSDNHPYEEGQAKSGEKSHDSLIILLYVWLHNKKKIYKSGNSHFWRLKPSEITSFSNF